jgi:hypothetical protein
MPLALAEIRSRAFRFAHDWRSANDEIAEAQTFLNEFFQVFGIARRRVAAFESRITHTDGRRGRIDLLWKGVALIEMKSRGGNLDRAFAQARDYFPGLADHDLPGFILVCDFGRFRLYDLDAGRQTEFELAELPDRIELFDFISGWKTHRYEEGLPVNREAAESMGALHDALKEQGFAGHELEVLLVRLVFCLFAEDTGIFETAAFRGFLETRTAVDGADLGARLNELFDILNTPEDARQRNLPDDLRAFPYVNGRLFEERLRPAAFDLGMRETLLSAAKLGWGDISPAIFGALFQSIMDPALRRRLGAHYTSEANILKALGPLFLDDLRARVEAAIAARNRRRLTELHDELAGTGVFDPACGCGNFLVVAYRELRRMELDILKALYPKNLPELDTRMIRLDVDRYYGIELHEFPAQIAQLALWLCDHQMNQDASLAFGRSVLRLPLRATPHIHHGNALRTDWREIAPRERVLFVVGNPPFVGARMKSADQSQDVAQVFGKAMGDLDYVACWYRKAADYIDGTTIRCALVSTNSLSQGEQPGMLWTQLARFRLHIHFAHRTFRWDNDARNVAAVHCVIIGFAQAAPVARRLFDYATPKAPPQEQAAANINAYLLDAPNVLVLPRSTPISDVPPMVFGSMPNDGGHLLLTDEERTALVAQCPEAGRWIRACLGSQEYLNDLPRWCLWLVDIPPDALRRMPPVLERVEAVRAYRLGSKRPATRKLAAMPALFGENRQPATPYLLVPRVSSEDRPFIPVGFMPPEVIATDACLVVPDADPCLFGLLSSSMHMAWVRNIGGRLESRYRYSATLTYNAFPFPTLSDARREDIAAKAQEVLEVRARHRPASLATLYNPETMPPDLVQAHRALDRVVDRAYRAQVFASELDRARFLLTEYQRLAAPLDARPATKKPQRRGR